MIEGLAIALIVAGTFFFCAGTVGLVRFPDAATQLHAVAKADNLGLGLVILGLALSSGSILTAAKLLLIWAVALAASTTSCHLVAFHLDRTNERS